MKSVTHKERSAVFLDRDGTLLDDPGYLSDPEGIVFFPDVVDSLRRLQASGFLLVVVTNQSGIGRGYFSEENGLEVNLRMWELLGRQGVSLAGLYYCRHHPDAGCRCRKPGTLMAERALSDFRIPPETSWMVGDAVKDVQMGLMAGLRSILVMTGKNLEGEIPAGALVKKNLSRAVDHILLSGVAP
ncbi:MAG: HAD family hydrolase [Proteobacteria bacterium]|nr:HAD family hydrolase [Pseudomonadota bacterium]